VWSHRFQNLLLEWQQLRLVLQKLARHGQCCCQPLVHLEVLQLSL
jgi:hypothetical protein